jgi:predicted dinucleotide-binding enzyme
MDKTAKASVSAFIKSRGLRPRDTGDLSMAHWLEGAGLLSRGSARGMSRVTEMAGATPLTAATHTAA